MIEQQGGGRGTQGSRPRVRTGVALVLLVAAGLASLPPTVARIRRIVAARAAHPDHLSGFNRRLEPVRELRLARVGYLPRMALRSDPMALRSDTHFLWTRYALAPTQVLPGPLGRFVFTDLRFERDPGATVPDDFAVERDFGDGLLLLRRKAQ